MRRLPTVLVVLAGFVLAGTAWWVIWPARGRLDPFSRFAIRLFVSSLVPEPATEKDWQQAKVYHGGLRGKDCAIPYHTLVRLRKVLEVEENITAYAVKVGNVRSSEGYLRTSVWSNKANRMVTVLWEQDRKQPGPGRTARGGLSLDERGRDRGLDVDIGFGIMLRDGRRYENEPSLAILVRSPDGRQTTATIPYEHRLYVSTACFALCPTPIAVMPKMHAGPRGGLASIMVVDTEKLELVGEIVPPEEARRTDAYFAYDEDNQVLVALGFDVDWVMAIDLRDYLARRGGTGDRQTTGVPRAAGGGEPQAGPQVKADGSPALGAKR